MDHPNIKIITILEITKIFTDIETAIARLDEKCDNIAISRAMSITHEALLAITENRTIKPEFLTHKAYSHYPHDT